MNEMLPGILGVITMFITVVIIPWLFVIWIKHDMTKSHHQEMFILYGKPIPPKRKWFKRDK